MAGVGLQFTDGKTYQELGTFSADFAESKTGSATTYSYIGIYGLSEAPNVEFYIVEDSYTPLPFKPDGTQVGMLTTDGGSYDIFKYTPITTGQPITQVFSIRRTSRPCGHISISDHFAKWTELGMPLALLIQIRTEPSRREGLDRNERRGRVLNVLNRGVRLRARAAAATATGEFESVVLGKLTEVDILVELGGGAGSGDFTTVRVTVN